MYVIRCLKDGGYWSIVDQRFRGWLWASKFLHLREAESIAQSTNLPCEIVKTYNSEK